MRCEKGVGRWEGAPTTKDGGLLNASARVLSLNPLVAVAAVLCFNLRSCSPVARREARHGRSVAQLVPSRLRFLAILEASEIQEDVLLVPNEWFLL